MANGLARSASAGYASRAVIGQETIDRVRRQTDIVELIGETVRLQKRGRSYVGLCPFHKEKTGSFTVNGERGRYHCFGCAVDGDVFKFVQETEGLTFMEAVRRLAERANIEIVETVSDAERRRQGELRRQQDELHEVSNAAAAYFECMLRDHPFGCYGREELERRGLVDSAATGPVADALQAFRVGYAPYGWDSLAEHLRKLGLSPTAGERVGLLAPRRSGSGHYDRFRHRLMFAVIDLQGRVVAFSGRALPEPSEAALRDAGLPVPTTRTDDPPAKYVNSPESQLYRKRETVFGLYQARQALRNGEPCVLVEGNFDVVTLHARGVRNVVAPLGTAFTSDQARQIRRFTPNVTLLFDADAAGRRAVATAREACREAGLVARVGTLPEGTDPDEYCRHHGAEGIRRVVGAARGLLEHLIDSVLDGTFAADDAKARGEKIKTVVNLLREEDDPTVRALAESHADHIAERLGIADARTLRALHAAVQQALNGPESVGRGPQPPPAAAPGRARSPDRREAITQEIFGAFLDYPELLDTPEALDSMALFEGDLAVAVAALRQSLQESCPLVPEQMLAKLPPSIHPFALARLAAPRPKLEDARTELLGNVQKLARLESGRRKSEVVEELQRAAATGDFDQELTLLREQLNRARERHGLGER